mgnify:CR=1 FL=1
MKFKHITDNDGYEWVVNSDYIVLLEPLGNNEWEKGARLHMRKESCSMRTEFELDYDGAMAVREWLLEC